MDSSKGISILLSLFFLFFLQQGTFSQIQDIKKSSKENSSSNNNSSNNNSGSNDGSDISGCISGIFDGLGCLSSIFGGLGDDKSNHPSGFITSVEQEKKLELKRKRQAERHEKAVIVKGGSNVSLDIRANFDLSLHKGLYTDRDRNQHEKYYTHINYLPGLRANLKFLLLDFRYNILTEYTDDFPDSFKSLEAMLLLNLSANQYFDILLGTGVQYEEYGGSVFQEFYAGAKIPTNNLRDYLDFDTRFSYDPNSKDFPFFEISGRYNVRFLEIEKLTGYITLGANYQNYYTSYDIWGGRSGIVLNIH